MIRLLLLFIFVCIGHSASAQNASADFERNNHSYALIGSLDSFSDEADAFPAQNITRLYVYPNPVNTTCFIIPPEKQGGFLLSVYDFSGKRILMKEFTAGPSQHSAQLDLSSYSNGLYFLSLVYKTSLSICTTTIVKE